MRFTEGLIISSRRPPAARIRAAVPKRKARQVGEPAGLRGPSAGSNWKAVARYAFIFHHQGEAESQGYCLNSRAAARRQWA
jgi:hypothetical protein